MGVGVCREIPTATLPAALCVRGLAGRLTSNLSVRQVLAEFRVDF
jgi:hypothetical protein